jgi:DNA repair photolyase
MKLPLFNAPRAGFCTCLPKYNLNTYLGRCAHKCVYCYAVKFPSFLGLAQPRLKLLEQIEGMVKNTKLRLPVMMSDCTDPYQPLEKEHKITRRCAEILAKQGFPLLIVTKSDMVIRDIDIFKQTPTVVAVTITTPNEDIAGLIEPHAPTPERRLSALQKIVDSGLAAVARIDPILPTINDNEKDFEKLVSNLANIGVRQVTVATMKPVKGFFSTLKRTRPRLYERLTKLYAEGKWLVGYKYLPRERRKKILEKLRPIVLRYGLDFASCREGFSQLHTTFCDGTAFCRNLLETYFHKRQKLAS